MDRSTDIDLPDHLFRLASRQHGIVARDDLRSIGASDGWIARQVDGRRLHRIHPRVYAVGHVAMSREASWYADVRAHGPDAVLGGFAAAAAWRLTRRRSVPVTVVLPTQRRSVGDVDVATAAWSVDHRTEWRNILILTPAGTIAFLAARVGVGELVHMIAQAEFHQYDLLPELEELAGGRRLRRGSPRLRLAIEQYRGGDRGSESSFEDALYRIVEDVLPVRPVRNLGMHLRRSGSIRLDIAWPRFRLNVEADGTASHVRPAQQRKDAVRDAELAAIGWYTIRVAEDVFRAMPLEVAHDLRTSVAEYGGLASPVR